MAICEERLLSVSRAEPRTVARARWGSVALALGGATLMAIRLDLPGFFDNEGRYAEVAREMLLRHDWISPHLDFTLFLNKPPLTFWLAALVFRIAGPSEWARLVSVGAAAVALLATCRLGALLYGEVVGLVGGLALATTLGFVLEARTLRPDMLLTASVVAALWCWQAAERTRTRRGWWLAGLYGAVAVGVLAKGLIPLVMVGFPIAVVTLRDHGWRGLERLRPGLGLAVIALVVLPWHVAVSLRHPGFAWDYVVNQHLLFFLDRKLPRDSEGDSLVFFLIAFAGRAVPWIVLVPLTLGEAVRGAARTASVPARASFILCAWAGGLLLFFTLAPSRLEHYSIPALPAAALLAARAWQRARAGSVRKGMWIYVGVLGVLVAAVGLVGLARGRGLLARTYWIEQMPGLLALATPAGVTLAVTGGLIVLVAVRRRPDWLVGTLAVCMVPAVVILLRAEVEAEPLFSWRPLAQTLVASMPSDAEIVFESPQEYQLVGGLAFYTRRPITLLAPPGFVAPTYLAGQLDAMFLAPDAFTRRWSSGERLAFVSDPQHRRDEPTGLVPPPFHVLGRYGDRWVVTNFSAGSTR